MKPAVIVFGARGRFGRATLQAFAAAGWRVTALLRPGTDVSVLPGVRTVQADAFDRVALAEASRGQDVIVNAFNLPYEQWRERVPALTEAVIAAAKASQATVLLAGNVYNYGAAMPPLLDENTPQLGQGKGRVRREMEQAYRDSAVRTIVLRTGDFMERTKTGNWFDAHMTQHLEKGNFTYPGPLNVPHAWAYLPDVARAAVGLAEQRAVLPSFADVPFPGFTLTGAELRTALEAVVGHELRVKSFPWFALRLLSPFSPMLREVCAMRYLWDTPHQLSSQRLEQWLPGFTPTPLLDALADAVGCVTAGGLATPAPQAGNTMGPPQLVSR